MKRNSVQKFQKNTIKSPAKELIKHKIDVVDT